MFTWDIGQEILYTIKQNKLRTVLTAFGVFWGILMLILLLGAGKGMQHGIEKTFSGDAEDSMWIFGRQTSIPYQGLAPGRQVQLTEDDMAAIQDMAGVDIAAAENPLGSIWQGDVVVTYKKETAAFTVFGVSDGFLDIKLFDDYVYGRGINALDQEQFRKVVILGTRVVERLFPMNTDPTGEFVTINGVTFRVVGVFYDPGRQGSMSERIYMPLTTFQQTFGKGNKINLIAVTPKPGVDGFALEKEIVTLLKERQRIAPADERALRVHNRAESAQTFKNLFSAINIFIWFVGLGTLAAGIVGISNIMIITVKDRTTEIGIRKALGATPFSIVNLVLLESVGLTAIAGYTGLVLGVGIIEGFNYLLRRFQLELPFFSNPEINFNVALSATLLLIIVGAIAGLIPALKAARITPIEAMQAK